MATGYTYKIVEDKNYTFDEFARKCATSFGACIHLRDSEVDYTKPLPLQEESQLHKNSLVQAKKELEAFQKLSDEDFIALYKEYAKSTKTIYEQRNQRKKEEADVYNEFLKQANDYLPPTESHVNLKNFMIQQIKDSIDFDCKEIVAEENVLSPLEWKNFRLKEFAWKIEYHTEGMQKEKERIEKANKWITEFENSLK